MMYDAPIKFRLTQHFGSAKVAFSQDLAKILKSWSIYTLVHTELHAGRAGPQARGCGPSIINSLRALRAEFFCRGP